MDNPRLPRARKKSSLTIRVERESETISSGWFDLRLIVLLALIITCPVRANAIEFQTGRTFDAGGSPGYPGRGAAVIVADFNGDGRNDFAVAVNGGSQISIMMTNRDGTVSVTQQLQTGLSFSSNGLFPQTPVFAIGDFNGDGKPDIAFSLKSDPAGQAVLVFINDGTGKFGAPVTIVSGVVVDSMAVGDFNRNGKFELAVLARSPSSDHNNIIVYGRDSHGGWSALHSIDVAGSGALAVGDFNGDGVPDILVGNESLSYNIPTSAPVPAGDLILIPGSKAKGFEAPVVVARGIGFVSQIGVADLNHDGQLDLVLSVFVPTNLPTPFCTPAVDGNCFFVSDHNLLVLLGSSKGSSASNTNELFREVSRYHRAPASEPFFFSTPISISDLNGDSKLDIVVDGDILLGDGDGHFDRVASYVPPALAVSDVDGDGKVDLITTLLTELVVLPGNGDGTFQGPVGLPSDVANPTFGGYIAATTGDFNGDGIPDLAMYALQGETGQPSRVLVYLNRGNGIFGEPTSSIVVAQVPDKFGPGSDLVAGDFNDDGNVDLVTVGGASNVVTAYLGDGDGTFRKGPETQIGQLLGSATVQDFNHDGNLDIATIEAQNSPALAGSLYVLSGNGDGSFNPASPVSIGSSLETIDSGDLLHTGGDDRHTVGNDIVVLSCSQNSSGESSCPNESSVNIISSLSKPTPSINSVITTQQATTLAIGDFNHDGFMDFVVGNFGVIDSPPFFVPTLTVYLGDGSGNFLVSQVISGFAEQVVVADFNGDGNLDLLTDGYVMFLGNGDGTFVQSTTLDVFPRLDTGFSRNLHVADLNGDGAPDVISTDGFVIYNSGGTFVTTSQSANPAEFGQIVTISATVSAGLPGTGQPKGSVDFYDDSSLPSQKIGTGVLTGKRASINTSNLSVGTHMIRARYLGDGNFNPHDGQARALTVIVNPGGQGSGGGSGGSGNSNDNCIVPGNHVPIQTVRSIDLSRNGTMGLSKATHNLHEVGKLGDQELGKPRITASPVAPEGELGVANQRGLPIDGLALGLFGFDGLTNLDSLLAGDPTPPHQQRSVEPSDQALAVNGTQIVQIVNSAMAVYTKNGTLLSGPIAVNTVFGLPPVVNPQTSSFGPFVTDPRVLWESDTSRWFITALEIDANPTDGNFLNHARVLLAVSQTSDATASYYQYSIDITDSGFGNCPCLGDQPLIGANQDALFITTDQFAFSDSSFQTALVLAIDKYDLARGSALTSVALQSLQTGDEPGFAIQPAQISPGARRPLEHGGTEFFVSSLGFSKVRDNRLAVWSVTNTSSLHTDRPNLQIQQALVSTESYSTPEAVQQKNGPRILSPLEPLELLDTNDDRAQQVFYANGKLYTSLTTGLPSRAAAQTGVAWFVIDPSTDICPFNASLIGQGYVVAADGTSLMFPAIGVDRFGVGVIAFSMSGVNLFPSVGYVEFRQSGLEGEIQIAAAGTGPEDGFSGYRSLGGNGEARWGDYSAVTVSADGEIWLAGEYIPNRPRAPEANWGTFVVRVRQKTAR
jgi:hypothetical protein